MLRPLAIAATLIFAPITAMAAEMIQKTSPHSVAVTLDRLEAALAKAGATVFARVDHAKGAKSVDLELADAELLIFGNPKLGTPAMQASITAGLDLPLRVLAYADDNGATQVIYHAPSSLAETHGIPADAKVLKMMTGALDNLTSAAVASD